MSIAATTRMRRVLIAGAVALLFGPGFYFARGANQEPIPATARADDGMETAVFAGGCFWCMEPPFDKLAGVVSTTAGYTGGKTKNPKYKQVSSGRSGHLESIAIRYDPKKISYAELLEVFWHNVDPRQKNGQFCDRGSQYRSAIFYRDEGQKRLVEESKRAVAKELGKAIATDILPAQTFWPAEEYHQDYYLKNPIRYKFYRYQCGRDQRLTAVWGAKAGK